MKLVSVRIRMFRNILDSGEVAIQKDVTCFVGKNESGKTAFLHALQRLRSVKGDIAFDILYHYPAWLEKKHRLEGIALEKTKAVTATFQFEQADRNAMEQRFGPGVLKSDEVSHGIEYGGQRFYNLKTDEKTAIANVIGRAALPESVTAEAGDLSKFQAVGELVQKLRAKADDAVAHEAANNLEREMTAALGGTSFDDAVWRLVEQRMPKFLYFDDYHFLPSEVDIRKVLAGKETDLDAGERTARSLLQLAGAANEYLLNPDYERRKRELENVANSLTADVLKYWSQNPGLRVEIDITQIAQPNPQGGQTTVLDKLKIRMYDDRHRLSLPFSERSTGFRWFFSFLAEFSAYERTQVPLVILLDEPGLGLHGRAQRDYLRFIDEHLATKHQVIYTTHSPFMVESGKRERVRIVEDKGPETGAIVSQDVLSMDPDTLFPLLGALGYDLAQHLLIGPNNVIVEGTSDWTYLTVFSTFLKEQSRRGLNEKWTLLPVGGADLIPTFVALLGHHLDVTVVVDSRTEAHQRLVRLAREGYLSRQRIVALGEIFEKPDSNIEDVFSEDDYLRLYNETYGTAVTPAELTGTDSIVARIVRFRGTYDHGRPADVLLRQRDTLLPRFGQHTLDRFEQLCDRINRAGELPATRAVGGPHP